MKRLFIAAGCLVFFCAGWTFGRGQTTTHPPGGGTWKALSSADRKLYLAALVEGYRLGILHAGSSAMAKFAPEKVSAMTPAQKKDYEESLAWAHKATSILLESPSRSGLEAAMSTFYADYRNMPVCFEDAILFSAASLGGNAATEQELAVARKKGAQSGCR